MQEEADAFIALPGGFGTLEELLEMVTWQQLGIHEKPVGVLNISGFYNHLLAFADHLVHEVGTLDMRLQFLQTPLRNYLNNLASGSRYCLE